VYNLHYRKFCSWQHTFLQNKENKKGAKQRNNNKINPFVFSIRIHFNASKIFHRLPPPHLLPKDLLPTNPRCQTERKSNEMFLKQLLVLGLEMIMIVLFVISLTLQ